MVTIRCQSKFQFFSHLTYNLIGYYIMNSKKWKFILVISLRVEHYKWVSSFIILKQFFKSQNRPLLEQHFSTNHPSSLSLQCQSLHICCGVFLIISIISNNQSGMLCYRDLDARQRIRFMKVSIYQQLTYINCKLTDRQNWFNLFQSFLLIGI